METLKDFGCRSSLAVAPGERVSLQAQKAMWPQPSGSRCYSPILGTSGLQSILAVVAGDSRGLSSGQPCTRGNEGGSRVPAAKWPVMGHIHSTGEAAEASWKPVGGPDLLIAELC